MKTDLYTKTVLTIIAICLAVITLQNVDVVPKAYAADKTAGADIITGSSVRYGLVPVNPDGSITVKISAAENIDVNIRDISTDDELNVNIKEIGGGYLPYGGPIPITTK